jgi:hypothetical protein
MPGTYWFAGHAASPHQGCGANRRDAWARVKSFLCVRKDRDAQINADVFNADLLAFIKG